MSNSFSSHSDESESRRPLTADHRTLGKLLSEKIPLPPLNAREIERFSGYGANWHQDVKMPRKNRTRLTARPMIIPHFGRKRSFPLENRWRAGSLEEFARGAHQQEPEEGGSPARARCQEPASKCAEAALPLTCRGCACPRRPCADRPSARARAASRSPRR